VVLTVACVLKSGGIYDATWVERLRNGVARHLPVRHKFVCLSDLPVPCDRIRLLHDWPGWWAKIELLQFEGPVLYFDLDTAIVGDLSDLARYARGCLFAMLRDFYAPEHCGSGVMAWGGNSPSFIYHGFEESMMHVRRARMGDQALIEEAYGRQNISRLQDALPGQIVSYKVHCQNGIPDGARVVCLHGRPKFGDMPVNDPVRAAWEMAA